MHKCTLLGRSCCRNSNSGGQRNASMLTTFHGDCTFASTAEGSPASQSDDVTLRLLLRLSDVWLQTRSLRSQLIGEVSSSLALFAKLTKPSGLYSSRAWVVWAASGFVKHKSSQTGAVQVGRDRANCMVQGIGSGISLSWCTSKDYNLSSKRL